MYTGQLSVNLGGQRIKGRVDELLNIFKIGCFFQDSLFQQLVIAQEVIPSINSVVAISFLNECFDPKPF